MQVEPQITGLWYKKKEQARCALQKQDQDSILLMTESDNVVGSRLCFAVCAAGLLQKGAFAMLRHLVCSTCSLLRGQRQLRGDAAQLTRVADSSNSRNMWSDKLTLRRLQCALTNKDWGSHFHTAPHWPGAGTRASVACNSVWHD